VFLEDANVICTGDIMNSNHRYQQVDSPMAATSAV